MNEQTPPLSTFATMELMMGLQIPLASPLKAVADSLKASMGPMTTDISPEEMERRTAYAFALELHPLEELRDKYLGETVVICGGGHSLDFEAVRAAKAAGAKVCVVNTVHDPLIEAGIIPDFSVMIDPNERVAGYQTPHPDVKYLIGSTVHHLVWRKFRDAGVTPYLFVPIMTDTQHEKIAERFPDADLCFVAGVTTVGLRASNVMGWLGFLTHELHGFDSCYAPGQDGVLGQKLYSVPKPVIHHDAREITVVSRRDRRRFTCRSNGAMARQAMGFRAMLIMNPNAEVNDRVGKIKFRVAGDGLIPWMAWIDSELRRDLEHTNPEVMAAKYGDAAHWDYFRGKPYE